ncbi:undecaprenyl-phosphate glucose phosphotransferase [Marinomonas pontica]|uniref:undecaprenyl-phosphate glucose phosphotransferase n=1 Tax=Marinomonas pontica TaxID=264739 RepID=UPI002244A574|nr:undecaprenyl-phosphate glucose phosphotransferase [Marinomonas pontica]MCW8354472.1 undecaprenyl-phosphate glucose phosphotransferase [Marinomonas pontica]
MKKGLTLKEHSALITMGQRTLDIACLFTTGLLSYWLRFSHLDLNTAHKNVLLLGVIIGASLLSISGGYRAWRGSSFSSEIKCVISAMVATFLLLALSAYATQTAELYSRAWVTTWLLSSIFFILSYRFVLRQILGTLRARGLNIRRVLIIGDGDLAQNVADKLLQNTSMGLVVKGFISNKASQKNETVIKNIPIVGCLEEIDKLVLEMHIDQVWIALPICEVAQMEQVQTALATSAVTIRMIPDIYGFQLLNHSMTEVAGLPVINLSTSHMIEDKNRFLKSLEDKILSGLILLCISPIMLGLAVGVRLSSPGPIFYRQERVSWNGRPFDMLKFRSMAVDSEKDGVKWGGATSMSVTKFGAFIRKTSLDELPQFINVLKGDMSIVGPRPERTVFVDQFKHEIPGYMQKHMVKAGITGWAQINGWRGDTDLKKRIECDLYYIEHWSFWLDMKIIFLTFWKGFIHKNAA